jgi:deoxyribonuclease V
MDFEQIIHLQEELAKKVISKNILPPEIKTICGVDVSYKDNKAYCSAVILDRKSLEILESKSSSSAISSPYIPGFFMLREAKPILITLKKLRKNFDILLVDGHGRLHPRKCGLACYVGLNLDKPVIGVAKKLLCGKIRPDSKIELDGKVLGYQIKNKKTIYVSTGHKINLRTAKKIVTELILDNNWYPEPLKIADQNSRYYRKTKSATS